MKVIKAHFNQRTESPGDTHAKIQLEPKTVKKETVRWRKTTTGGHLTP